MFFLLSLALAADCPSYPQPAVSISFDGAAWEVRGDGHTQCLYRVDDRDDKTLVKRWEGPAPRSMFPTVEGLVMATDHWILLTDGADHWQLPITLPTAPQGACFNRESGRLNLIVNEERWVIQVSDGTVVERRPGRLSCG